MLQVKPMPAQIAPERLARLAEIDPATVGHFRDWGFIDPEIRPVIPARRVVGTAVTVVAPPLDLSMVSYALGLVRPGDVLVIDRLGDARHVCMGGVVALAAKQAGVAAIIIDGVACDFAEIRQYDLPVWCRGEAVLVGKPLAVAGAMNIPASCGGVAVLPGYAVLADTGGVFIFPPEEIEEIVETSLPMQAREPVTLQRLRAGEKLPAISGSKAKVDAALAAQSSRR